MSVEILYFEGCPSFERLLPRVRELVDQSGGDPAAIMLRAIETPEDAETSRFLGSPSVRVDGIDVDPGAAERDDFGLKCRIYRSAEGQTPTPPDDWIRTALGGDEGQLTTQLESVAVAVVNAFPQMDERDQCLALWLVRTLVQGEPVSQAELARAADEPEDFVAGALARWAGVFYDDQRRVIGFIGLAIRPTSHGLLLDGRQLWGWCAWDTLFLPELIGREARVSSTCPVTGVRVTLTVGAAGVRDLDPPDAVVSFLIPDKPFDANVMQDFCHFVHFFASAQAGEQWTVAHEGTFLMSVRDAHELGRRTNSAQFPHALQTGGPNRQAMSPAAFSRVNDRGL